MTKKKENNNIIKYYETINTKTNFIISAYYPEGI